MADHLTLHDIKAIKLLGKGATGTVFLATTPSLPTPFALKAIPTSTTSHSRALLELSLLSSPTFPSHPLLPSLLAVVDSSTVLAWALPFCPGGDLHGVRLKQPDGVFSVGAVRFFAAEIVVALGCLHGVGVVYRDLKPENVLVQESGHVMLTDFDLSKPTPCGFRKGKAWTCRVAPVDRRLNSFVGTEEYVAPEVVKGSGHGFGVDWWALGVVLYEMLHGFTPFRGRNRYETFSNVVSKPVEFSGKSDPRLVDLVTRLLAKDPAHRLGARGGADEVRDHDFFRGLTWDLLMDVARPPHIPPPPCDVDEAVGFDVEEYFERREAEELKDRSFEELF